MRILRLLSPLWYLMLVIDDRWTSSEYASCLPFAALPKRISGVGIVPADEGLGNFAQLAWDSYLPNSSEGSDPLMSPLSGSLGPHMVCNLGCRPRLSSDEGIAYAEQGWTVGQTMGVPKGTLRVHYDG